ncbi:siderophore ABC transporter substrate-binding protein [Marinilactibacillus kalidii]|uniref:siderophore ABC transporter substrate-binding protein n=1 Tax=Marinilactibacillus kalidii TaxID=2820274 RepID=UPI001FC9A79D|nr:siderophore ABC transporter substrate-binding protein [Marinilactibacillus kalidii]
MIKKLWVLSLMTVGLLSACSGEAADENDELSSNSLDVEEIAVTDSNGEKVEVPVEPERVVIFDMGLLDTFVELDESDRVVGAATQSLPSYLEQVDQSTIHSVGSLKEPDLEAIYALEPDLILISGRQLDFLDELNEIAPTLYLSVDLTNYWDSFEKNMLTVGQILNKEDQVELNIKEISDEVAELKQSAQNTEMTALVTILNEGSLSAFGENSRYGMLYDVFGFEPIDNSIEASTHGQSVSFEYVLQEDPDLLFVVDRTKAIGGDTSESDLSANPVIKETLSYKNNQIIYLDPELWYLSGGGLQSMNLMIDELKTQVDLSEN